MGNDYDKIFAPMKKTISKQTILPRDYANFLSELKQRIRTAQTKASLSVNRELIVLYWDLGRQILERQEKEAWGTGIMARLSKDLQRSFPGIKGFSVQNIRRMRAFYSAYSGDLLKRAQPVRVLEGTKLPQAVAEIPWGHNVLIFEKIKNPVERFWYAHKTLENGWSRAVLWHQIDTKLYQRQGKIKKLTNFKHTLPAPQSDLAVEMMKDPYNFDFLTLGEAAHERDFERELLKHIQKFLIELGKGFAFVGSQYYIQVGGEDFYIDLLFYHLKLRCFIAIDLKTTEFKAEYAGKMNLYLSAIDDGFRHTTDQPTIGIILCKSKNKLIAEYALRDTHKPIGVSSYKLTHSLPKQLKGNLPTIEELEDELSSEKRKKEKLKKANQ